MYRKSELEAIAAMMSERFGIKIVAAGNRCATDGNVIYLPSSIHDKASPELLRLVRFYLDHEVGHIVGKSFPKFKDACEREDSRLFKAICNGIDDVRIERVMSDLYAGCDINLRLGHVALEDILAAKAKDDPGFRDVYYQAGVTPYYIGRGCPKPDWVSKDVWNHFMQYEDDLRSFDDSSRTVDEVIAFAKKLADEFRDLVKESMKQGGEGQSDDAVTIPKPSSDGQSSGSGESDEEGNGSCEGGDDFADEEPDSSDSGSGDGDESEEESDDEKGSKPDADGAKGSDVGDSSDSGASSDTSDDDACPGDDSDESVDPMDALREAVEDSGDGNGYHVLPEYQIKWETVDSTWEWATSTLEAQARRFHLTQGNTVQSVDVYSVDVYSVDVYKAYYDSHYKSYAAAMQTRLRQLIMSTDKRGFLLGQKRGRPDPRRLAALATGSSDHAMRQRWVRPGMDTACYLLVDLSSSMTGASYDGMNRIGAAALACGAFVHAINLTNVDTKVVGFSDSMNKDWRDRASEDGINANSFYGYPLTLVVAKDWGRDCHDLHKLHAYAAGGTPIHGAIQEASTDLAVRSDPRRIMFVFTDGEIPIDKTKEVVTNVESRGMEVVFIGLEPLLLSNLQDVSPKSVAVSDMNDLGPVLLEKLREVMFSD